MVCRFRALALPAGTGKKQEQRAQQQQQTAGGGQAAASLAHPAAAPSHATSQQAGAPRSSGLAPSVAAGGSNGGGGCSSSSGAAVRVAITLLPPSLQQTGVGRGGESWLLVASAPSRQDACPGAHARLAIGKTLLMSHFLAPAAVPADNSSQYDEVGIRINRWTEEQEAELLKLGSDPAYRLQQLGSSKLQWKVIGRHLGHTQQGARLAFMKLRSPHQDAKREC